jgi:hypothetical protein
MTRDDIEIHLEPRIQAAVDALKEHEGDENGRKWVRVSHNTRYYRDGSWEDVSWTKDIEVKA